MRQRRSGTESGVNKRSTRQNNDQGLYEKEIRAREKKDTYPATRYKKRRSTELEISEIFEIVDSH